MARGKYNLALEITAEGAMAVREINKVEDKANRSFGGTRAAGISAFGSIGMAIGGLMGPIGMVAKGFSSALSIIGDIGKALLALPMKGLKLGLGGLAAGAAALYGAHKALGPAAQMERSQITLSAMGKGGMFDFLTKASSGRPFEMGETVQAGVLMEAFKLNSRENLNTVMDAAAAFGKPLEEIVRMLGYARSGRTGEALESSARIGITRDDLRRHGLQFEKSGAVMKGMENKLLPVMLQLMKNRYGGIAQQIGTGSYSGAVSDLKDSLFRAFANAFKDLIPYATQVVRGIGEVITTAGKWAASFDWNGVGAGLVKYFNDAKLIANSLFSKEGRSAIKDAIVNGFQIVGKNFPDLASAIVIDLMRAFEWGGKALEVYIGKGLMMFADIMPKAGVLLGDAITSVINVLIRAMMTVYAGLSWMMSKIPGIGPQELKGKTYAQIYDKAVAEARLPTVTGANFDALKSQLKAKEMGLGEKPIGGQTSSAVAKMLSDLKDEAVKTREVLQEQEKQRNIRELDAYLKNKESELAGTKVEMVMQEQRTALLGMWTIEKQRWAFERGQQIDINF